MAEQRVGSRGRRMGSSRRRQLRRDAGEEPPWAAAVMQRVQEVVQEQRGDTEGFVTRADMQKLQEEVIPCSTEELELLFDGMDAAGSGQLRTEEFTAGLRQFLSSQKVSKEHRRRKTASRRSCLVLASPTWEGTDSEEKKHFAAFMEQLGVDDRWEEQEIWQLWAKLRKDEPQLLGNLEDFLAKMRHRIQEARSKKEALEEALNKRVAEHNQEVQQLCEALEQQIQEERQRMEQESTARSRLHCAVLQRALDARDREVQRLVAAQEELEAQCHSLSSTQRAASAENRQLEENNRALEEQLQHIHAQLQQTHECLRAARAQQRAEEPRDGVEAELPGETPPSLQMSPEQHRSEMGVRLGYHGSEPKRRSTHHVVWEKPAADTNTSRLLSVEEDPFPEFLKEEQFSGQGSLLREMSDAIAALSTQKLQAPGDAAHCPHDDAEPQTGPPGSAPRETHISHEGLEEDLREGRAAAELRAGDGTQAGASAGAQEEGAAQGDSVEGAGQSLEQMERVLSVQGRGAGGEQQVLKEAESPQEALGDSTEMGEQARVGVEGEGWVQGKMKWEKVQLPGEGENMEAVLKAQKVELPVGGSAADVLWVQGEQLELEVPRWVEVQTAAVQGVTEAPNPEKVDGEGSGTVGHCWGEMEGTELQPLSVDGDLGTEQAENIRPDVQLVEEADRAEPELEEGAGAAAVLGEGLSPAEIPAGSPAGGLVLVSAQGLEMEEAEGSPAESLLHGIPSPEALRDGLDDTAIHLREDAENGGQEPAEPGLLNQPLCELQGEEARQAEGTAAELSLQDKAVSLELLEALSGDTHVQLIAELGEMEESLEAALQPLSVAGDLGTEQAENIGPDMQLVEEADRAEPELEEGAGAAAVLGEGLSPAEIAAGSPAGGLVLVSAQGLETEEAEGSPTKTLLHGIPSPEALRDGLDDTAIHLSEDAEDGGQEPAEPGLLSQPVCELQETGDGQAEGAAAELSLQDKAVSLELLEALSGDTHVQLIAELGEMEESLEAALQPLSVAGDLGTEQAENMGPDVQLVEEADRAELQSLYLGHQPHSEQAESMGPEVQLVGEVGKPELVEIEGEEDSQVDMQLQWGPSQEVPLGGGGHTVVQLTQEVEDEGQDVEHLKEERGMEVVQEEGTGKDELVLVSAQGLEMEEAEDSPEESLLHGIPSPEASRDGLDDTAIHVREDAEDGGQELAEPGLLNQPVCELQESGDGQAEGAAAELSPQEKAVSLEPLEGLSGDTHVQLIAELGEMEESLEAALQPTVAGDLGTEQAENIGPDVQLVEEADRAEPELEEGAGAAAVLGEGLSPAEIAAGSPAGGLVLVSAQGLEMEEAEGSPAESLLHGIPSPEASRDGLDDTAAHLREDAEDGGQELAEPGLLNQPLCELQGEEARQAQWAAAELQPQEESGSLKVLEALSGDTHVQLIAELGEMEESLETELQPLSVAGDLGTEQAENVGPDVQLVEEADRAELQPLYLGHQPRSEQAESMGPEVQLVGEVGKPELVEIEGEEDSQVDVQLQWGPSQEVPLGGGGHTAVQLTQEVEDEGQDVEHLKEERGMEVVQEEGTGKDELVLVSAQGLEMEEAEGSPAESLLHGIPSPEASRDGLDDTAIHVREDAEDGGQELAEPGLLSQPLCELQGEEARHAEGAAAELSPQEKAVSLELLEGLSGDTHVQLIAELGEMEESLEAALQPLNVAGDLGTEQAENMGPDMQLVEEADRAEPELEEGAGAAAVLGEGLSPAEIAAGSPAGGLVLVSAQELEGKETESLVQLEELTLPYGDSTGADGKPLCSVGLWEVAENPAVGLEAAPCMADNTDVWNRNVEPILHPEYAAAAGHAHPAAGLVAASGPELQILEETQRERADAEGRPLDGARGLEVVQGARLEAEARISVAAQHLELKQGRDASAATLASPVSEVPLQISTLNLDVMMQEDVLIPDVQLVGGSGQAAQRQLQEQVSAQADKGRLHAAPQQPQKPPGVMEAEQAAAGPAETPKQEVPPASALHTGIQQGGDAAEDLSGMALGDSPLVEAVSSMVELSGGQREELNVEKKQEMEQKMSLGGKPSPGEPEAVTVNGAEAAPKDSVEPDHLYNVLFVGDSNVGKTSFLYRLHADTFNPHLAATVGLDYQVKNLMVDNRHFALRMWDSAGQERYHSVTKQFFRKADGVVLMYDITSQYSFADVRYWLSCIQEGAEDGITVLLLGNKTDCAAERQVPTQEGERLAQEHQLLFYECSAASGHNVIESIVSLVRALKVCEDQLRNKAEEVPKVPQKKKGCCW
ncbi:ras-related protein Rab-44 isoform X2 [Gallus gallus]|uniref:ras-related protein Rab-44 isoform X2 n=1 Tax=Gallus gallus TaxID=9031 RepID=UPI001AE1EB68|nr:ras-related protein Rab-44 isoform X2 [Gallus gallus]